MDVVDAKEAVDLATAQTYSENVFLFVPNLIGMSDPLEPRTSRFNVWCAWLGYARVILAGLSLHFMSYHPKYCTLAYSISCLLDAVDGQAARALGQTSKFGAVLDMVTDRYLSTLCFFILRLTKYGSGAQRPAYYAICPLCTRTTRLFSRA